jgi:hypothetical protein
MRKKGLEIFLSFLGTLSIIFFYYHQILLNPEKYLTTDEGDGMKAFYVFASHIKNDISYHQFSGMNYPYGQTHIFTDGQTIIANTFKLLSASFPFFQTNCMAIYNLMMILSFPFCALFLCLIIQRLSLPLVFTVLGSITITLLSPQIFRMFGHPTLSYVFFFPLSWWLLIKFDESIKRKYLWSVLIALNSVFWFFIHPYYIMILCIFYVGYWIIEFIQTPTKIKYLKRIIVPFSLHVLLPLFVTRIYIMYEDIHSFRSESPWGFWNYHASWNTVFMPNHPPFNSIYYYFFPHKSQMWEGWAYVGLPAVFVTFFSIVKIIRYIIKRNYNLIVNPALPSILKSAIWTSFLALLFSMCLPFQLGMHFLVEWFPFIKQFRSLGRFAWIFYYVFTVYSLYVLYLSYRYFKIKKRRVIAYTLTGLYFSLYFIEASAYHEEGGERSTSGINYFDLRYLPDEYRLLIAEVEKIKTNYQCIIPLPFYHVGSENFGKESTALSMRSSMAVSYWANMPLLASSSARSPIIEAKNIMQFFSPSWFQKEIEKDLHSKKDFLILYTKEELTDVEAQWLNRGNRVYTASNFELWSLPYDSVFRDNSQYFINEFHTKQNSLKVINGFYKTTTDSIIYKNFDDNKSEFEYRGKGALQGNKKEELTLLPMAKYYLASSKDYMLSFWYRNKDELSNQITCVLEQCDANGENCKWDFMWSSSESMTIDGDWSLVEKRIHLTNINNQFRVFFKAEKNSNQNIYVDELIIREAQTEAYQIIDDNLIKNNIKLDSIIKLDDVWVLQEKHKVH